ncbi:MAG: methionyl-tRNA formyltransferase [Candidatus Woesebacteria bacterium]|nr:methionyl-tRNA formyltransferase [Candidatus Woesebacteria bacterium]
MKIVFFGTPDYVLPVLTAVHKKFVTGPGKSPIAAVVTQSPKPVGRKQVITFSPVDKWAHERNIPIHYAANELAIDSIEADMGILASYGEIIKKDVIDLFPHGILVIHPSLLPKYRGASPIPAAITAGEAVTGVTIFKMDEKVDHGPIISQFREDVLPTDTTETLRARLFERSAEVLVELLTPYLQGKITPKVQDDSQATFTKIITREDGFIDLTRSDPVNAERFIRAMLPWPGAWALINLQITQSTNDKSGIKRLKILKSHIEDGKLVLDEVQLEGKERVSWKQFMDGYKDATFVAED